MQGNALSVSNLFKLLGKPKFGVRARAHPIGKDPQSAQVREINGWIVGCLLKWYKANV